MPLLQNVELAKPPIPIVCEDVRKNTNLLNTGSFDLSFFHSFNYGTINNISSISTASDLSVFNHNNLFVKLTNKLESQFAKKRDLYSNYSINFIKDKFSIVSNDLIELNPDIISFELTNESSFFFTVRKNSFTLFYQYFFDSDEHEIEEESLLACFHNDEKMPSFAGRNIEVIEKIRSII